jgi:hypothetical protein
MFDNYHKYNYYNISTYTTINGLGIKYLFYDCVDKIIKEKNNINVIENVNDDLILINNDNINNKNNPSAPINAIETSKSYEEILEHVNTYYKDEKYKEYKHYPKPILEIYKKSINNNLISEVDKKYYNYNIQNISLDDIISEKFKDRILTKIKSLLIDEEIINYDKILFEIQDDNCHFFIWRKNFTKKYKSRPSNFKILFDNHDINYIRKLKKKYTLNFENEKLLKIAVEIIGLKFKI